MSKIITFPLVKNSTRVSADSARRLHLSPNLALSFIDQFGHPQRAMLMSSAALHTGSLGPAATTLLFSSLGAALALCGAQLTELSQVQSVCLELMSVSEEEKEEEQAEEVDDSSWPSFAYREGDDAVA